MLEVAGRIAGLHAQVLSSAELTLAARVDDLGARRRSDEFPLWHAARSTTRLWETGAWQRGFGVTLGELGG
jgi:hypothetical protein